MTTKEKELIQLIRDSDDPEKAILTAVEIITEFLRQGESAQEHGPADLREPS
jgi:hypothetical protein